MSDLGNKKVFADNLRSYITKKGVTQKEVAAIIGVSTGTFCDWIKARAYPRMDKVQLLAEYFGIEKSDLIEEHKFENQYYLEKEANAIAKQLVNDPVSFEIFVTIKKLSPSNKEIVLNLINSLTKGEDK